MCWGHNLTFDQLKFELPQQGDQTYCSFCICKFLSWANSFPSKSKEREPVMGPVGRVLLAESVWVKSGKEKNMKLSNKCLYIPSADAIAHIYFILKSLSHDLARSLGHHRRLCNPFLFIAGKVHPFQLFNIVLPLLLLSSSSFYFHCSLELSLPDQKILKCVQMYGWMTCHFTSFQQYFIYIWTMGG